MAARGGFTWSRRMDTVARGRQTDAAMQAMLRAASVEFSERENAAENAKSFVVANTFQHAERLADAVGSHAESRDTVRIDGPCMLSACVYDQRASLALERSETSIQNVGTTLTRIAAWHSLAAGHQDIVGSIHESMIGHLSVVVGRGAHWVLKNRGSKSRARSLTRASKGCRSPFTWHIPVMSPRLVGCGSRLTSMGFPPPERIGKVRVAVLGDTGQSPFPSSPAASSFTSSNLRSLEPDGWLRRGHVCVCVPVPTVRVRAPSPHLDCLTSCPATGTRLVDRPAPQLSPRPRILSLHQTHALSHASTFPLSTPHTHSHARSPLPPAARAGCGKSSLVHLITSGKAGRGLHSSTSQLNLSRF